MSQVDDARTWAAPSGAHGALGSAAQAPSPESERGTPPRSGWSGDRPLRTPFQLSLPPRNVVEDF